MAADVQVRVENSAPPGLVQAPFPRGPEEDEQLVGVRDPFLKKGDVAWTCFKPFVCD